MESPFCTEPRAGDPESSPDSAAWSQDSGWLFSSPGERS